MEKQLTYLYLMAWQIGNRRTSCASCARCAACGHLRGYARNCPGRLTHQSLLPNFYQQRAPRDGFAHGDMNSFDTAGGW